MTPIQKFKNQAEKIQARFVQEIKSLRSGGATAQLLDSVMVEAYETTMKLHEVASIQAVDATLLHVSPWDKSLLQSVEKAIASAGLNLNPVVDGDILRIAVPPLTEEKRKESVKRLHAKAEDARVLMRTARLEAKKDIENSKNDDGVSEDDISRALAELEESMKESLDTIVSITDKKEAELLKL